MGAGGGGKHWMRSQQTQLLDEMPRAMMVIPGMSHIVLEEEPAWMHCRRLGLSGIMKVE